jgi:hypothetical protein
MMAKRLPRNRDLPNPHSLFDTVYFYGGQANDHEARYWQALASFGDQFNTIRDMEDACVMRVPMMRLGGW